jgi:hypothetical protein
MSKTLAGLIGAQETVVAEVIAKLEQMTGYHSEDIHLVAEIEAANRRYLTDLSLDPADTRGRELYYALTCRYCIDNKHLEDVLDVKPSDSVDKRLKAVIDFSAHAKLPRDVWVLKRTVAKELLRSHPPRKLMKLLCYRSVDSMLKRGNIAQMYALLPQVESQRWLNVFWKMHAELTPNQFESRQAEIVIMPIANGCRLMAKGKALSAVGQLGVVALWPNSAAMRMGTLGLSAWVLQTISNLRINNTYLKLQQFQPNFGDLLVKTWRLGAVPAVYFDNFTVPWRSLQAYYGKNPASQHPSALGPHIQVEDLYHQSTAHAIANLFAAGQWWANAEPLAINYKSGPVSMNLLDVVTNYGADLSYRKRKFTVFQAALTDELLHRYLSNQSVENYLLALLEESTATEELKSMREADFSAPSNRQANPA